MDVLCLLAQNNGDVVLRDELIDTVWDVEFGSDESLTRAICVLRKTFGNQETTEAIIETIPKRGYRLATDVMPLLTDISAPDITSEKAELPSIAVLAFLDMSARHDQEYFADGVSEEIINALVHLQRLKVVARTSSFSFKGKNTNVREISEALHVGYIVEGSVRKKGNQLRVTAQLIDATEDIHLWSETYDGKVDRTFGLQERVAQSVCKEMRLLVQI